MSPEDIWQAAEIFWGILLGTEEFGAPDHKWWAKIRQIFWPEENEVLSISISSDRYLAPLLITSGVIVSAAALAYEKMAEWKNTEMGQQWVATLHRFLNEVLTQESLVVVCGVLIGVFFILMAGGETVVEQIKNKKFQKD